MVNLGFNAEMPAIPEEEDEPEAFYKRASAPGGFSSCDPAPEHSQLRQRQGGKQRLMGPPPTPVFQDPLAGTRFTSGGCTYDIIENIDPRKLEAVVEKAMSEGIYKVCDVSDNKVYAFKRLTIARAGRARAETNVLLQIRNVGEPRHLNSLKQFLWDIETKTPSVILEFCDLGNVEQDIRRHMNNRMSRYHEKDLLITFASLAKALRFLHDGVDVDRPEVVNPGWNTIAHLDLKPANVFLTSKGAKGIQPRVVLGDFGCAVTREDVVDNRSSAWQISYGTPGWYPPETNDRIAPRYGKPTDIWQLGGVIQVMSLLSTSPSMNMVRRGFPCSVDYGASLNDMVSLCLNQDYAKRPKIADLVDHLKTVIDFNEF